MPPKQESLCRFRPKNAIAESVQSMNLRHAVILSVDRDGLPDGGAQHWHDTIRAIREKPNVIIEVLIPDFQGIPLIWTLLLMLSPINFPQY